MFVGGSRCGCTFAERQQMPSWIWPLVSARTCCFGCSGYLCVRSFGREQHGERIVDEVQLLQARDWLALDVDVDVVGQVTPFTVVARLRDDLRIDEGPELLAEEVREVGDEARAWRRARGSG